MAPLRFGRRCVFCGQKPEEKTREHVFPQWLVALADCQNDSFHLQMRFSKIGGLKQIGFNSLIMPACGSCNDRYSRLEASVKPIIAALLEGPVEVSPNEASMLLDWLDKVRIGLWLWRLSVEGVDSISPKFCVDTRIAGKDRFLKISRTDYPTRAITLFGTHSRAFAVMPSFITIAVNNTIITSGSVDGFAGRWLGTPYLEDLAPHAENSGALAGRLRMSSEKICEPPWADRLLLTGQSILQPIFRFQTSIGKEQTAMTDTYAAKAAINAHEGIGAIHFAERLEQISRVDRDQNLRLGTSTPVQWRRAHFLADAEILRLQRYYCAEFMKTEGSDSNAMKTGRMDCEFLLQQLETAAENRMGFPMRLADGVVLPRPGGQLTRA